MKLYCKLGLVLLASLLGSGIAIARPSPFDQQPYQFITVDQELNDALLTLAKQVGVKVQISKEVSGKVRGRLPAMSQQKFFDFLSQTYGLIDYFDGAVLHVYSSQEIQNRVIPLAGASPVMVNQALKDLSMLDERYPLKTSEFGGVLIATGPERYMDIIAQVVTQLSPEAGGSVVVLNGGTPGWQPGTNVSKIVDPTESE